MIKTEDLVSIIVPVYNIEAYVERCIKSILNQSYKTIEVILVDDGSTDCSGNICDLYAAKDKRIQVIHKKNGGLVTARKAGLNLATGRYIGFVDGDDYIDENMYQLLIKNIKETDADFVHSGCVIEEKGEIFSDSIVINLENNEKRVNFLKKYILDQNSDSYISPSIWSKLFKAELIKNSYKLVPNTQSTGEDWINIVESIFQSKKISILNLSAYHYTIRKGSLSHLENIEDFMWQAGYYNALKDVLRRHKCYDNMKKWLDSLLINTIMYCLERRYSNDFAIMRYSFGKRELILNKKIVLYGAGEVGKSYYSQLCRYPDCQIVGWIDQKYENIHFEHCLEITGKEQLKTIDYDYLIIAVKDRKKAELIKNALILESGVQESKIIWEKPKNICGVCME